MIPRNEIFQKITTNVGKKDKMADCRSWSKGVSDTEALIGQFSLLFYVFEIF